MCYLKATGRSEVRESDKSSGTALSIASCQKGHQHGGASSLMTRKHWGLMFAR